MTAIGGRPVEQVAPPPKRPEPVKPAAAKSDVMTVPDKPAKPQPKPPPPPVAKPVSRVAQPPTTGSRITQGNSRAETGAIGIGTGLTVGGGGTGGELTSSNFCCPGYLQEMVTTIKSRWQQQQPERGSVVMKFTIQRDGRVSDVSVEQGATFLLNNASTRPLVGLQLGPLPAAITESTLTIHLTFVYQ